MKSKQLIEVKRTDMFGRLLMEIPVVLACWIWKGHASTHIAHDKSVLSEIKASVVLVSTPKSGNG